MSSIFLKQLYFLFKHRPVVEIAWIGWNRASQTPLFSLKQHALSFQSSAAEIQHCLVSAGDVGCGVFECFENNSCEIRGLQEICMTFLHNAGKFDSQVSTWLSTVPPRLVSLRCIQRMTPSWHRLRPGSCFTRCRWIWSRGFKLVARSQDVCIAKQSYY